MNIRSTLLLLAIVFTALSCKKDETPEVDTPRVIENETFHNTLLIDGHDFDGTIIRNCTFENIEGDGLQIRDVDNLCVENCTFRNISEDGIRFRNSGTSTGVKISGNTFYNIGENGILAPENHINALIIDNLIFDVATDNTSSQIGTPHHGIYFQGKNVTITQNEIYNVLNDNGNGISLRTCGSISRNVLHHATDHGISYFSDHPGYGEELLIENNMIYGNGKRGVNLASDGNPSNHIGRAVLRFNTIVAADQSPIGIKDNLEGLEILLTGNIAERTDGGSTYFFTELPYTDAFNLTATGDVGFVDFANRDLHITTASPAYNAAVGAASFPAVDIDGDTRMDSSLDIGADER